MKQIVTRQGKRFALFAAVMGAAALAWAASPHFIDSKTKALLQADGDLEVSFKEAGLGDTATTYALTADAATTCTCVTNSGRCPQAANKVTATSAVAGGGTFDPKNGTVSATLVASAPECPSSAPPTCGGGQHLELSAIAYTNILLKDVTHNVTATGLPSSLGATFFQCP